MKPILSCKFNVSAQQPPASPKLQKCERISKGLEKLQVSYSRKLDKVG